MAREQKVLKFFIRLMLPIFFLGGFGGFWSLFLIGMNQTKTVGEAWSADRHYRASVVVWNASGGCGDRTSSYVIVERQTLHVQTGEFTPFCLDGAPDRISIHWLDTNTLAIDCAGCEGSYDYAEENWGKLRFAYDLDKPLGSGMTNQNAIRFRRVCRAAPLGRR